MNDDEQSKIFPTRHSDSRSDGGAMGASQERQMRASVPDTNSFNTRFMTNADGSTTRLRTRGGMCEYVTEQLATTTPKKNPEKVYMESGQLEYTWPGEGNPTRSYSAKWHFLDIDPSGNYLGYIRYQNPSDIGTQNNDPALSESMDSLAVGYPKKTTNEADDASREAYANATIAKKMIMSMFPASLYSGKMRLFMQAQYGAKESNNNPLGLKAAGSSFVLTYTRTNVELTLGLWAHNSPGIFTAVDLNGDTSFWLLSVTTTQFTAYPIKQDDAGKELLKTYNSSTVTDRTKLEPYIFAHSFISLTEGTIYPISGMPAGAPLAYGWKFNSTGSKASIVLHEQVGAFGDLKWRAWECHLSFTCSDGVFSVTETITNYGYWTDGWGSYNIFVPENDIATRLWCNSIAMSDGAAEAFNFSGVVVYGYYVDDAWEPVVMSRIVDVSTRYTQIDNLLYSAIYGPELPNRAQYGFHLGDYFYEQHNIFSSDSMSVSFDGVSTSGTNEYGSHLFVYGTMTQSGGDGPRSYTEGFLTWGGPSCDFATSAPGYSAILAESYPGGDLDYGPFPPNFIGVTPALAVSDSTSYLGNYIDAWSLVIPGLDAEAVYIPKKRRHDVVSSFARSIKTSEVVWKQTYYGLSGNPYDLYAYYPIVGSSWPYTVEHSSDPPPNGTESSVLCFNSEIHGVQGVPSGSYGAIFEVSFLYPYYDPGMFFFTSYGGRYIGSEGIKSHNSVRSQDRFVGWA